MAPVKRLISEDISPFQRQLLEGALRERPLLATRRRMAAALGVSPLVVYAGVAKAFFGTVLGKVGLGVIVGVSAVVLQPAPEFGSVEARVAEPLVLAQAALPSDLVLPAAETGAPPGAVQSGNATSLPREAGVDEAPLPTRLPTRGRPKQAPGAAEATRQLHVPKLPAVPALEQARLVKPKVLAKPKSKRPETAKSTLAEEVVLLDRARSLVISGRTAQALSVLDDYRRRFPDGILARESQVLRQRAVANNR